MSRAIGRKPYDTIKCELDKALARVKLLEDANRDADRLLVHRHYETFFAVPIRKEQFNAIIDDDRRRDAWLDQLFDGDRSPRADDGSYTVEADVCDSEVMPRISLYRVRGKYTEPDGTTITHIYALVPV